MAHVDDDPQVPSVGDVIGPGLAKLTELRPNAAKHLGRGRYGNIAHGWKGQFEVERKRICEEALASRLPFATGSALSELAASEYDTPRSSEGAVASLGEVEIERTVVHYFRDQALDVPAATDADGIVALLEAFVDVMLAHAASVYDASTGLGAHYVADTTSFATAAADTADFLADYAVGGLVLNLYGALASWIGFVTAHVSGYVWHPDPDPLNIPPAVTPLGGDSGLFGLTDVTWDTASGQQKTVLLTMANSTRTAINGHIALESRPGTVRAGTSFRLAPDPAAVPPVKGGTYLVLEDTPVSTGQQRAVVRVEASKAGAFANLPRWYHVPITLGPSVDTSPPGPTLTVSTPALYDQGAKLPFVATTLRAAGGSEGQSDPELRRAAAAGYQGSAGPTTTALVAGALRTVGASRTVVLDDKTKATSYAYPVDASWAQSDSWLAQVEQELRTNWRGFGARMAIGRVWNLVVRLEATVMLRDAKDLADTSAIYAEIQRTCRAYFDDRPDWYVFRKAAIRGAISHASKKVLSCPLVVVRNGLGVPLAEPTQPRAGSILVHYYFADSAIDVTFTGPS